MPSTVSTRTRHSRCRQRHPTSSPTSEAHVLSKHHMHILSGLCLLQRRTESNSSIPTPRSPLICPRRTGDGAVHGALRESKAGRDRLSRAGSLTRPHVGAFVINLSFVELQTWWQSRLLKYVPACRSMCGHLQSTETDF